MQILQDGTYAISAAMKVAPGGCSMFISNYLTWTGTDRRVLTHQASPAGLWENACSTVARLKAGTFVDVQVTIPAGSCTVAIDSHGSQRRCR